MLIEFRVKNYCCLRDEQVLSFVPTDDKTLEECNVYETGVPSVPRLLRTAAIFGPIAGGKSTVLRALQLMIRMVVYSANLDTQLLPVFPFFLDKTSHNEPTAFEISFLHEGRRYQYGFSCTPERILEEYLFEYVTSRPKTLFQRTYDPENKKENYIFGKTLRGRKNIWREATQKNVLFLSRAAQLNSKQLFPIWQDYFVPSIVFNKEHTPSEKLILQRIAHDEQLQKTVCDFLAAADTGITGIEIKNKDSDQNKGGEEKESSYLFSFKHATPYGDMILPSWLESEGTLQLFYYIEPLVITLHYGALLAIDELDSSLHPLLVRHIVDMFQSQKTNKHGAQLIFTTHDATLLQSDPPLLRRDQIWLVEKQKDQASDLYSLAEFKGQERADFLRSYLRGLYGGIPLLREWRNEE